MKTEWSLTAGSYLDQLPAVERSRVLHMVKRLAADWNSLDGVHLRKLPDDHGDLFMLRVGSDLRVVVRRQDDLVTVVDVIRRSQIDGLRRATERHLAAG